MLGSAGRSPDLDDRRLGVPPLVEFVVGALVVLGLLAVVGRFIARDASGEIRLPRVVDDSIGMWALRRLTGRRLWDRRTGDGLDAELPVEPSASVATPATLDATATALSATPLADAPSAAGPAVVAPRSGVAAGARMPSSSRPLAPHVVSRTPVADMRRREQARRRPSPPTSRLAAVGAAAALIVVAVVAIGASLPPRGPQGAVLGETGRPASAPASQIAAAPSATSADPASSSEGPARDGSPPSAAITGLTKTSIKGSANVRLTLAWAVADGGSGLRSQLLQRRTDNGSWISVTLASPSARTAAFTVSPGHLYTFRIRAVDRAGNVGVFAVRAIRA